jgi:hypothetical protein
VKALLGRLASKLRRRPILVTYDAATVSVFLYYQHVLPQLEAATGRPWHLKPAGEVDPAGLQGYRAVISMRGISEQSRAILDAARRAGCRTIYDTDDNLLLISQMIPDPDNDWRRIFDAARPHIEAMLAGADFVKVYAPSARPFFTPYNEKVFVIRPYQILTRECALAPREGPLKVGFLGSAYKDEEFTPVLPAIERLLAERADVVFEFFGFVPESLRGRPGVTVVKWESGYFDYRRRLDGLGWHAGLAPLRDIGFNRCKSNNRYREYAASSIAGIYSDAPVYGDSIADGRTGLLVAQESTEAWYTAILRLTGDEELRRSIIRNAYEDVRTNYRAEGYVREVAALMNRRAARG